MEKILKTHAGVENHALLAEKHYQQGDYQTAIICLNQAIDQDPLNLKYRQKVFDISMKISDLMTAELVIQHMQILYAAAENYLSAKIALANQKYAQAQDFIKIVLEEFPQCQSAQLLSEQISLCANNVDELAKQAAMTELAELQKSQQQWLPYSQARLLDCKQQSLQAKNILHDLVRQFPDFYPAWLSLSSIYMNENKPRRTFKYIEQYGKFVPNKAEHYRVLGVAYYNLYKNLPKSIEMYDQALVCAPDDSSLLFLKALNELQVGDYINGREHYEHRSIIAKLDEP